MVVAGWTDTSICDITKGFTQLGFIVQRGGACAEVAFVDFSQFPGKFIYKERGSSWVSVSIMSNVQSIRMDKKINPWRGKTAAEYSVFTFFASFQRFSKYYVICILVSHKFLCETSLRWITTSPALKPDAVLLHVSIPDWNICKFLGQLLYNLLSSLRLGVCCNRLIPFSIMWLYDRTSAY